MGKKSTAIEALPLSDLTVDLRLQDLEDDRALDEETSDGLRHLPRDVIEDDL